MSLVSTLHSLLASLLAVLRAGARRVGARRAGSPARRLVGAAHRVGGEAGQTTAEYALVLLGAAALAGLLLAWATDSGAVARLFDAVLRRITRDVG
jgi:hypothetical protein